MNSNQEKIYKGGDIKLVELYVLGHPIQYRIPNSDTWIDIPPHKPNNYQDVYVYRVSNEKYYFRVKPKYAFYFFHLEHRFKEELKKVYLFNYPEYEPSGAYLMVKVNEKGKAIDSIISTTEKVNVDSEFFR